MTENVTLTIDNHTVTVPAGMLVVDAAKRIGVDIPVFCYHPKLEPVGMCRMCLVEIGRPVIDRETRKPVLDEAGSPVIQFGAKLETGCTVQVSEGMVVRGYTQHVHDARSEMLEFFLTSHPLDCPVCDKGGECPLQNLTMAHGPGTSRFLLDEKIHLAKQVPLGELIFLDRERCIQCARCTRFQDEIVDDPVIGFYNRGRKLEIASFTDPGFDSYWSGNTTDLCPVGALTTADFRFGARPWELNSAASICNQCPVGCNLTFNTRREAKSGGGFAIKRAMPRQNEAVNEIWMCDKGRFSSYHFSESEDRLSEPMIRRSGELVAVDWGTALDFIAEQLGALDGSLLTLASGRLSNEDLFNLRKLSEHAGGQTALYTQLAGGDLVSKYGLSAGSNLGDLGPGDAILVIASDLEEEAPVWWLRVKQAAERGATLVVANPRPTRLDPFAAHLLRYTYGGELAVLDRLPDAVGQAANLLIFYGGEGLGLAGSARLAQALAGLLEAGGRTGKPNNGLVAVHPRPNDQGAWELGFRPIPDLAGAIRSAGAVYIAGADPYGDQAIDESVRAPFTIVQDVLLTRTAELADVVLPAAAFVERDGSYISGERRAQRFYAAVPVLPGARPDFTITAQIAVRLGLELEGRYALRAFAALAAEVWAFNRLTYVELSRTEEQWPIVGRGDMYYGGTTYENSQGLGAPLAPGEPGDPWKAPAVEAVSGLAAVPVTLLYDQGTVIARSNTLAPRLAQPHILVHPEDAGRFGLHDGGRAEVRIGGRAAELDVRVSEDALPGFVLVPRSMGLWLDAIERVTVTSVEKELA